MAALGFGQIAKALSIDQLTLLRKVPELRGKLFEAANRFGALQRLQGNYDDALKFFRLTLTAYEALGGFASQSLSRKESVMDAQYRVADLQLVIGKHVEAMQLFRNGFATADQIAAADSENVGAKRLRALFKDGIGRAQLAQGAATEALTTFRDNLRTAKVFTDADPGNAVWQGYIAIGHGGNCATKKN